MADKPDDLPPKAAPAPQPITEAVTGMRHLAGTLGSTVREFEAGHVETEAAKRQHGTVLWHAINRLNELAALLDRQDARETRLDPSLRPRRRLR